MEFKLALTNLFFREEKVSLAFRRSPRLIRECDTTISGLWLGNMNYEYS